MNVHIVERERHHAAASLATPFPARMIDENLSHESAGQRQQVRAVLDAHVIDVCETQIRLMHECGCLQQVAGVSAAPRAVTRYRFAIGRTSWSTRKRSWSNSMR